MGDETGLLAVPGVAHVIIFGGAVRQIQIQPDVTKMASYGFTPQTWRTRRGAPWPCAARVLSISPISGC
jgi:hypothetical protein